MSDARIIHCVDVACVKLQPLILTVQIKWDMHVRQWRQCVKNVGDVVGKGLCETELNTENYSIFASVGQSYFLISNGSCHLLSVVLQNQTTLAGFSIIWLRPCSLRNYATGFFVWFVFYRFFMLLECQPKVTFLSR